MYASSAHADYASSSRWYKSKSEDDRTLIQVSLILLGHYKGLVDGVFGRNTYNALTAYERVAHGYGDGVLSADQLTQLELGAYEVYEAFGFEDLEDEVTGMRLPVPVNLTPSSSRAKWGTHWEAWDRGVELETLAIPETDTSFESLYRRLRTAGRRVITYDVKRQDMFVLSGHLADKSFYTAFVRSRGTSFGYSVSWERQYHDVGSVLSVFLASAFQVPSQGPRYDPPAKSAPEERSDPSTGSGFSISTSGMIVTNAHVVENCSAIEVAGHGRASLLSSDEEKDLAIIRVAGRTPSFARIEGRDLALGQEVVVVGYPLSPLMGDALTVSPGYVGNLTGLFGDEAGFTVDGNIQPGNSGGPVVDMSGHVVGVARGKLPEALLLEVVGTTGGSLGFAIGAETLLDFLEPFRHRKAIGTKPTLSVQEVVAVAESFTHHIRCEK